MALGVEAKEKKKAWPPQIVSLSRDYREYHTDTTVRFTVKLDKTKMKEFEKEGFHKVFKLQTTLSLSNLVLFDSITNRTITFVLDSTKSSTKSRQRS
ncbi:hypothetical protein BV898_00846 [Hypsibius exemplaris]|uniref:DNA topoisomerase (ATP-hydrolyzing) n=1 Tax=Hypsibius exemplaris TaxID=2072580 RepID=A0A1W0XCC7_HYPEX|nr:hypothetical protein BV898_00846 [Hypsibius exemplaris]